MPRPPPSSTLFPYTTLFRSTVLKFHTWGSLADPKIAEHSNQYAAIPSLHIGWALWCGVSIYLCASRSEEHTSELQSRRDLVCRLLLEKKNMVGTSRGRIVLR